MVPPPTISCHAAPVFSWASTMPSQDSQTITITEASDTPHVSINSSTTLPSTSNAVETTAGTAREDDQDSSEELDDRISLLDDKEARPLIPSL